MEIPIKKDILNTNQNFANLARNLWDQYKILVINLMSSPGAGKTSLLEKTVQKARDSFSIGVIGGDLATQLDKERIEKTGIPVVQINTGKGCHLNAKQVHEATQKLPLDKLDIIFIENVGNLVCPAGFDLGEDLKATMLSVPEGEEKPLKYPIIFRESKALIVNKTDLVDFLKFDLELLKRNIKQINPDPKVFYVSCKTGQGLDEWINWLRDKVKERRQTSDIRH